MKLGIAPLTLGSRISVDLDQLKLAESLGFHSAWAGEAYGSDAVSIASWMLANSTKLKVGTAIMQMPARAPAMAGMTAMTLDQLSGGRFMMGIGPSGPQVVEGWYGVPFGKPMTRTREYISVLRQIFKREHPVQLDGEMYQIPYAGPGATGLGKPLKSVLHGNPDIPIYTAAITKGGLTLAGEIADGVLPIWMSPEKTHLVTDDVREGQKKGGRLGCPFDIAPTVFVRLVDPARGNIEEARQPMKANLALYIGGMGARGKNFYTDYATRLGYGDAALKIQDAYLDGRVKEAIGLVPDALVDELFLVGTEDQLRGRLAAWRDAGKAGEITTMLIFCRENRGLEILAEELL